MSNEVDSQLVSSTPRVRSAVTPETPSSIPAAPLYGAPSSIPIPYASGGNNAVFGNNAVSVLARPITEIIIIRIYL
jgi:hypothetical protein